VIRDRWVGALFYLLALAAVVWVFIGQILWRNEHFQLKDVKGIPRMWFSHPTQNQCDPNLVNCMSDYKALSELAYCIQHSGDTTVPHPAKCIYSDRHSLFTDGTVGHQVFVPTSEVVIEETSSCNPTAANGHSCTNEYTKIWNSTHSVYNESEIVYHANVEDFVVQLTSTYDRDGIEGTSLDHPGFYIECLDYQDAQGKVKSWKDRTKTTGKLCKSEREVPIKCIPGVGCQKGGLEKAPDLEDSIKQGQAAASAFHVESSLETEPAFVSESGRRLRSHHSHRAPQAGTYLQASPDLQKKPLTSVLQASPDVQEKRLTPDVYASTWGDTFKLGLLMRLAGIDLDHQFNMDGMTTRMAGTIIEVEATYSNMQHFLSSLGWSQVHYKYRVTERKLPYVSKETLHPDQPADYPKTRRRLLQHGILVNFEVAGQFGFFNIVYLLIVLSTSLALFATANRVTEIVAIYLHPRKRNYFQLKYDVSADFSNMWKCSKCGYLNMDEHKHCQGLDKWESPLDTPLCGAPRKKAPTHTGI